MRFFVESLLFGVGPGAAVQGASIEEIANRNAGPMIGSHLITTDGNTARIATPASAVDASGAAQDASSRLELLSAEFTPTLNGETRQIQLELALKFKSGASAVEHATTTSVSVTDGQLIVFPLQADGRAHLALRVETLRSDADLKRILERKRTAAREKP